MSRKARPLDGDPPDRTDGAGLRLDKWLWQARFVKSRILAAEITTRRKVRVNRTLVTKPHYRVRPGDVLTLAHDRTVRVVRVVALGSRRGPASEARTLYEDLDDPSPDAGGGKLNRR